MDLSFKDIKFMIEGVDNLMVKYLSAKAEKKSSKSQKYPPQNPQHQQ